MKFSVCAFTIIALLSGGAVGYGQQATANSPDDRLFDHIYGAVAGAYISNAMGAPV